MTERDQQPEPHRDRPQPQEPLTTEQHVANLEARLDHLEETLHRIANTVATVCVMVILMLFTGAWMFLGLPLIPSVLYGGKGKAPARATPPAPAPSASAPTVPTEQFALHEDF